MAVSSLIHTSSHPWTKAQDEALCKMVREGVAVAEIARRLSRTTEAVSRRMAEIGVRARASAA